MVDRRKQAEQVACIQPGHMYKMNTQNAFRRDSHLSYWLILVGVMANVCTESYERQMKVEEKEERGKKSY